jgi:hypothetical protein
MLSVFFLYIAADYTQHHLDTVHPAHTISKGLQQHHNNDMLI